MQWHTIRARKPIVPSLRAGFHVGSSYEFHQAEDLNPTLFHYIVGNVTVELKRLIDHAQPRQILVGDFRVGRGSGLPSLTTPEFVQLASTALAGLQGLELSGERVERVSAYLTGPGRGSDDFSIRVLDVRDKHGITRKAYNAKVNFHLENGPSILLGIKDEALEPKSKSTRVTQQRVSPKASRRAAN